MFEENGSKEAAELKPSKLSDAGTSPTGPPIKSSEVSNKFFSAAGTGLLGVATFLILTFSFPPVEAPDEGPAIDRLLWAVFGGSSLKGSSST